MSSRPQDLAFGSFPGSIKPDKDGKFRIEGLVPGLKYNLHVVKPPTYYLNLEVLGNKPTDLAIKAGETKDLGDIRVKPME